ncbi:MAG TPA: hypothetical protein VME70_05725 [Mycobacteriales bacterium]|nr:hypothetical protein [Mycobacteriales bacterium]
MSTHPWWADDAVAAKVQEPFRSDGEFWTSLAASADALLTLVAAAGVCAALAVSGVGGWALLPFVVPAAFTTRAWLVSRRSSRHSQAVFEDRRSWREAERSAVAAGFIRVLGHRHHDRRG